MTTRFHPRSGLGGSVSGLPVFDVVAYGALVDGITDDTPAWQACINAAAAAGGGRIISSISGVSLIAGALQDTGGANAQIVLPAIDAVDSEQITIVIEGAVPPPATFSVIGATPLPDNHLVLKSTLNAGAGGAVIGAQGPAGTFQGFTNVFLGMKNMSIRLPSNPVLTGLNLSKVTNVDLDNVAVDCGSYYVQGLTEPTTSSSYGIRLPANNNGAYTRLGAVNVIGFYNGYEFAEHTVGQQVTAWGCKRAFEFDAANHASKFQRMMAVHCTTGIMFTGTHYVDVDQFDVEHAESGWWVTTYDIDDASNFGHGSLAWHVVLANVGIDDTFTANGAANLNTHRVGETPAGGAALTVQDEGVSVDTATTQVNFVGDGVSVAQDAVGQVTVTVASAPSGSGELLMQDGVTSPPVPLETEDGSDWLYEG